jgi:hypothetical protein
VKRGSILDKRFLDLVMQDKSKKKQLKYDIVKKTYCSKSVWRWQSYLPDEILWRQKSSLVMGRVTDSWSIKIYCASQVTDAVGSCSRVSAILNYKEAYTELYFILEWMQLKQLENGLRWRRIVNGRGRYCACWDHVKFRNKLSLMQKFYCLIKFRAFSLWRAFLYIINNML